jgi:hypothetical protein
MFEIYALFYCVYTGGPDSYCDFERGPFETLAACEEARRPYGSAIERGNYIQSFECRSRMTDAWMPADEMSENPDDHPTLRTVPITEPPPAPPPRYIIGTCKGCPAESIESYIEPPGIGGGR